MAIKTTGRHLSEAELNAPDLDDDGNLYVEHYPLPGAEGIENPYLRRVWQEAVEGSADVQESDAVGVGDLATIESADEVSANVMQDETLQEAEEDPATEIINKEKSQRQQMLAEILVALYGEDAPAKARDLMMDRF